MANNWIIILMICGIIDVSISYNNNNIHERSIVIRQAVNNDDSIAIESNSTSLSRPSQNPFLEWLLGIAGVTTAKPPTGPLKPPAKCEQCSCGIVNKKTRIVGGQETEINQYSWMAMLMYSGKFYCGGSLINNVYVLTAAHCVSGFNQNKITVRLLEHDRTTKNNLYPKISRQVLRVIAHSGYSSASYNNDIALLRLDSPVEFSHYLRPVCLPVPKKSFTGLNGIVTGWGATEEGGQTSVFLQEVTVPIMSNTECRKSKYGPNRITDNMLCAGLTKGTKDSCQGDSGGPLHISNDSVHHIVGVVSWGEGCAKPNFPGVYSRVNRYRTWIKSNTVDACYCD